LMYIANGTTPSLGVISHIFYSLRTFIFSSFQPIESIPH